MNDEDFQKLVARFINEVESEADWECYFRFSKFPYALFFRVDPTEIVTVGFFHQHLDPAKWRELLKTR